MSEYWVAKLGGMYLVDVSMVEGQGIQTDWTKSRSLAFEYHERSCAELDANMFGGKAVRVVRKSKK